MLSYRNTYHGVCEGHTIYQAQFYGRLLVFVRLYPHRAPTLPLPCGFPIIAFLQTGSPLPFARRGLVLTLSSWFVSVFLARKPWFPRLERFSGQSGGRFGPCPRLDGDALGVRCEFAHFLEEAFHLGGVEVVHVTQMRRVRDEAFLIQLGHLAAGGM